MAKRSNLKPPAKRLCVGTSNNPQCFRFRMPIAPRCRSTEYGRLGARIPAHALYLLFRHHHAITFHIALLQIQIGMGRHTVVLSNCLFSWGRLNIQTAFAAILQTRRIRRPICACIIGRVGKRRAGYPKMARCTKGRKDGCRTEKPSEKNGGGKML